MPHVIVKLYSRRSNTEKKRLADGITTTVMKSLSSEEESISVAIEDVKPRGVSGESLRVQSLAARATQASVACRLPDDLPMSSRSLNMRFARTLSRNPRSRWFPRRLS